MTKRITNEDMGATLAYKILNEESTNYQWQVKDTDQLMLDSANKILEKLQREKGTEVKKWRAPIRTMTFGSKSLIGVPYGYGSDKSIIAMNRGSENHYLEMKSSGPVGFNVTPPGQIGFIKKDGTIDKHYENQIGLYENWDFKKFLFDREDVEKAAVSTQILKVGASEKTISFSDVSKNDSNHSAIQYLQGEGIITGYEDGTFRPGTVLRAPRLQ